ncbi:hypothetical protein ABTD62_20350, partial [Acinetobacter baumannii]
TQNAGKPPFKSRSCSDSGAIKIISWRPAAILLPSPTKEFEQRTFKPKYISFDCYGTLINFEMGPTARMLFADRVDEKRMPAFLDSF